MDIPLDEVIYVEAIASSSTGAAADADSTPTFSVMEEATDTDIGVGGNMTKRTSLTGDYRASFTASAANGFEVGKWYVVIGSATIGGIACKGVLKTFRIVAAENTAGYPAVDTVKWNNLATVALPLIPTTAGRTLDVSAGGEAGIDWANIGSPTTTVGLSGTTVKTATDVETDTADIQTRLPAALTSNGNMKSSLLEIISTSLTEGATGRIAAAWQAAWNVASSAWTSASVNQTGDSFARLGAPAGASIAADIASAKTDTGNLVTRVGTPSDLGSGATVAGNLVDIEAQTDDIGVAGAGLTDLGGMSTTMKAQVNAEVLDVLNVDTFAEPGQEAPAATNTLVKKIGYLFKAWRNKVTQTSTTYSLFADDTTTVDQKSTVSDDGTTATRGEITTGP